MAEWMLYIFVLDIKTYFIIMGIRNGCYNEMEMRYPSIQQDKDTIDTVSPITDLERENMFNDIIQTCDYALVTKKSLTLFQSITIPGLYILLVGANYLENIVNFRSLEEVRMRIFWVIMDLLDLLDLQATAWEAKLGEPPYITVGFIYFYCYIVLIILPPLSLAEMSKRNEVSMRN